MALFKAKRRYYGHFNHNWTTIGDVINITHNWNACYRHLARENFEVHWVDVDKGRALKWSNYLNCVETDLVLTVRVNYNALSFCVVECYSVW